MRTSCDGHKLWRLFASFLFQFNFKPAFIFVIFLFVCFFQSPVCHAQFFDQWLFHCRALSNTQQTRQEMNS